MASAATRLARRLPLRSVFVLSLRLCASKRRDQAQATAASLVWWRIAASTACRLNPRDSMQSAALGPHATEPSRCARPNSLDTRPFAPAAGRRGIRSAGKRPRCRRPQRRPSSGQRRRHRPDTVTGDHHPLLFQIRGESGHLTWASAVTGAKSAASFVSCIKTFNTKIN